MTDIETCPHIIVLRPLYEAFGSDGTKWRQKQCSSCSWSGETSCQTHAHTYQNNQYKSHLWANVCEQRDWSAILHPLCRIESHRGKLSVCVFIKASNESNEHTNPHEESYDGKNHAKVEAIDHGSQIWMEVSVPDVHDACRPSAWMLRVIHHWTGKIKQRQYLNSFVT